MWKMRKRRKWEGVVNSVLPTTVERVGSVLPYAESYHNKANNIETDDNNNGMDRLQLYININIHRIKYIMTYY